MSTALIPLIEQLHGQKILCIGDVMVDRFVYGHVDRISPEAPIPVLRTQREAVMLGGNGNVVRNIVAMEGCVTMVGVIGDDATGQELKSLVKELSNVDPILPIDPSRPTTVKVRYIADNQQLLRTDSEMSHALSTEMEDKVLAEIAKALPSCSVVILSDYAKGVLTKRLMAETIKMAKKENKPVLIDPKSRDFACYAGATILTPNRKELSEVTGKSIQTAEDAEAAARDLIKAHGFDGILCKLGADGVCLVMKDQPAKHFRALERKVFDVSGAGDTVVAVMALALASGGSFADSAELANIAGSVVVGKPGTAVVTRNELRHEIIHGQLSEGESKVASLENMIEIVAAWKAQGLKVGFTNGCFDLLHPGHLSLIRQSRAACDRLIIGLNSDASVKRLKGPTRPVQNESARAIVLAALADVDGVVIFGEDTPLELIKALRPDVLVKGADYTVETVVGSKEVIGWGGQVFLANLVQGQSTTSTIKRLQSGNS